MRDESESSRMGFSFFRWFREASAADSRSSHFSSSRFKVPINFPASLHGGFEETLPGSVSGRDSTIVTYLDDITLP